MAQHFSRQPLRTPPQPFSEAQDPALTSGLFWSRLLTYRPLLLLGGLWIVFVCTSAIAYHWLMFNEPVEATTYAEAPLAIATAQPEDLAPVPDLAVADVTEPQSATVTLWGLFSLVGLCSFGCFVLTQQIKSSNRPKRKRAHPGAKVLSAPRPSQPKRLTPYSPQRDSLVVPGARVVEALPQSIAPGRPMGPPPRPTTAVPHPVRATSAGTRARPQAAPYPPGHPSARLAVPPPQPQAPVVVSDDTDLALDWPEGSVAHALDVRQRRSLSSFM